MDTIRIRRANVILDISPEEKEQYMASGFSVVDKETGAVIEEAMSSDVKTLQIMVMDLRKENATLKAEISKLKGANKKATSSEKK